MTDVIDAGAGFDTIIMLGGALSFPVDNNLKNVEKFIVHAHSGATLNLTGQTEGFLLDGSDEAWHTGLTIIGGSGNDQFNKIWYNNWLMSGGGGDDTFYFGKAWWNDPTNGNYHNSPNVGITLATIDGGAGTDTITFAGGTLMKFAGDANIINVERIQLESSAIIDFSNQTESFIITGSTGGEFIVSGSGADTISAGNGNDTISGGQGNDLLTGDIGSDRFIIQTVATLNGLDIITDFNISASDSIFIDFGKPNGLTNQASLRGSGSFFQRAAEGSLIGANTGLIIGSVNISNLAEAKVYAEGLAGEAGGDIVYLIGSANAAANGEATLYRVDYTAPNAANVTALASLGNIAIANLTSNNLPQFAPATTQVNFTQRLIQPGNRVKLGAYWPNADGQFGTIAGYDQITDFNATDGTKQILQLPGIAYIAPEVTNFDGLDSALTFNGNANWRHSVSSVGKFTGSHPIQGDNHVAMMIDYLSINDIGNAGATVFFTADYGTAVRGSASHTWIYTQTSNSRGKNPVVMGDATSQNVYDGGYTVVNLIGTTLQGLETIPSGNNNFAIIS
jgi:hypothetical protein